MRKTHELKCWPIFFEDIITGLKRFEIRLNDRGFKSGDLVVLNEYDPVKDSYTGRRYWGQIGYILSHADGLAARYCIFSIAYGTKVQKRPYKNLARLNNTALRNKCRKANYAKSRPAKRTNKQWNWYEDKFIEVVVDSDKNIAKALGRSVQAIQQRRYLLRRINA